MNNETIKELLPIFKALKKATEILGEEMRDKIRRKLVSGALAENERDFLQNLRRDAAAEYLGMTRNNYERFLEGKEEIKQDKRIGKKNFFDL